MNTELGRVLLQYVALHGVCKYVSQAHLLYTVAPAPLPRVVAWSTSVQPWVHHPVQLSCPKVATVWA